MRVAIDARPLLAKQISGIPEYTGQLIQALAMAHPEVDWQLFYSSWHEQPVNWLDLGQLNNVEWCPLHRPNKVVNLTTKLFNRPQLDKHCSANVWLLPHFNFTALSDHVPTVLTIHDLSFIRQPEFFSWYRRFWHANLSLSRLVDRVDRIIAISENTKKDLVELLVVPENKITVIYSAVNPIFKVIDSSDPQLVTIGQKHKLPASFILSLATCEPRKNLVKIIQAYNHLRQRCPKIKHSLVMVGSQGWKQGAAYRAWQRSKYQQDIYWLGYLPTSDLPALYNQASLVIYPSLYEGFGLPVLEAMSCGRPVITASTTALPEVTSSATLLIDPTDSQALSRAMEQILINHQLAQQLSQASLERASQFNWLKTAEQYWQILNQLA